MSADLEREPGFERWTRVLVVLSAVLSVQGLSWMVIGSFEPFGVYDRHMAQALFGAEALSEDAARAFAFALVPFGATDAAYFALAGAVIHHAFPRREAWAYRAVVGSFGLWFAADTVGSLLVGAAFNVLWVNLPCVVIFGVPLWIVRSGFR